MLDLAGRHIRERAPQRQPFHVGTRLRESRRGHGGHDASLLLVAGTSGFGFRSGEVWGIHVAWSGNHRVYAERLPTGGHAVLGGGELLLPGEVSLAPGEAYTSPWVVGAYGAAGLDELSGRVHDFLRARPAHPRTPRPVILNTWEAVYFDADAATLRRSPTEPRRSGPSGSSSTTDGSGAAERGRGLGDWFVDADVWPQGLGGLVDHVRGLGMQFGLWVEPESVNPDSDLARAHPDWILATGGRLPPLSRLQQLLDLGTRRPGRTSSSASTRCSRSTRSSTSSGTSTATSSTAAGAQVARRPSTATPRPCMRCSTRSAAGTRASRSRAAPAGRADRSGDPRSDRPGLDQ